MENDISPQRRREMRAEREAAVIARAPKPEWKVAAHAQGIRVPDDPPAPPPAPRAGPLHPNQEIGHDIPTEDQREGVVFDAKPLEECWISSTGETGYGPVPRRMKKLVPYDSSAACYDFKPTTFKE
jgi:hypothetical protein